MVSVALQDTLTAIAADWGFSADELIAYAAEDEIGGFPERWPGGSLWSVEGQTLYALVRALRPVWVVEFGSWKGCSGSHLAAALQRNGHGFLTCVDPYPPALEVFAPELRPYIEVVGATAEHWLAEHDISDVGLTFEDTYHSQAVVAEIWQAVREYAPNGAVVVSHDALHATSREEVSAGMTQAVGDAWRAYITRPSDCGLGVWRK